MRTVIARTLVLDVDDTLYLEREYVRSGFAALEALVWSRWQVAGFAARAWQLFEQGARGDTFQRVLSAQGIQASPDDLAWLVRCYREHSPQISLLEDARRCLDALPPLFLAVLTDGPSPSQHAKIHALGLPRWARQLIVTADHGPDWGKPGLHGFRAIEAASGARGPDCVYIADNPLKDFAGPHQLGWQTIRMRRSGGLHAHVPSGDDVGAELASFEQLRIAMP